MKGHPAHQLGMTKRSHLLELALTKGGGMEKHGSSWRLIPISGGGYRFHLGVTSCAKEKNRNREKDAQGR